MQEKEPILKVEDLHYAYNGEKAALNGIDLNIYEGEKIAVIYSGSEEKAVEAAGQLADSYSFSKYRPEEKKLIKDIVRRIFIIEARSIGNADFTKTCCFS